MPLISIRSLPLPAPFDGSRAVTAIARALADATRVGIEHFMVTWEYLPAGHYAHAGTTAGEQPAESHPVLVDVTAPDFNPAETVEALLALLDGLVTEAAGVAAGNVFLVYRPVASGQVLDGGEVVEW
jgi:hypothetical protein